MLIDLHCHTKKVKTGEAHTRNVSTKVFAEKIETVSVKIVAITNHNCFDYEQYSDFYSEVASFCQVWPGIELDIIGKTNKRGHMIVIANPSEVESFNKNVSELLGDKNPDECLFELREVYEKLDCCDVVYIPHFHKEPPIAEEDIEELNRLLKDKSRLFKETSDYRSLGVFANYNYSVIIGSDVQNWDTYENCTFANLRLPVSSFSHFCMLAKKDQVIIDTLLSKKGSREMKISPHEGVHIKIRIFEDVNIFFGQKGTGKTELLKSIEKYFIEKSISCQSYYASTKEEDFSKLEKTSDLTRDVSKVNLLPCEEEFKYIKSWEDKNPTLLNAYSDWYKTKDHNLNKSKMKITDAVSLPVKSTHDFETIRDDYFKMGNTGVGKIHTIALQKYLSVEDAEALQILIKKLKESIHIALINSYIDNEAIRLVNYSLSKIKEIADKCSNTVSKPMSTGFEEFIMNRLSLYKAIRKININLTAKEFTEDVRIGELEDKGEIFIQNVYCMLNETSKTNEFTGKITILREIKKHLKHIENNFYLIVIVSNVRELNNTCTTENVKSTNSFLGLSKRIVTADKSPYSPSNGERGILLIQRLLRQESDVYVLDEPELGMGNSYINYTIVPQIIGLARRHKTIVIATHNANIAVRTLPYMSIYRVHKNGIYSTYAGNPFNDELVNIDNSNDRKSWTVESMHTLEGGKDAFYERKDIYESGK